MKITLVFPPQWSPNLPSLSLPSLSAYLKANGYNVQQRDLNIEAYEKILSPEYLAKIREKIVDKFSQMEQKETLLPEEQRKYYHLFRANLIGRYRIDEIQQAKAVLRDPAAFFNFHSYRQARLIMEVSLQMISSAYFPTQITLSTFQMEHSIQSTSDFLDVTQNKKENPFIELYNEYFLEQLLQEPPDLFGISIVGMSQVVPGLTLAKLIKSEHPHTHIVIGGSVFTEVIDQIKECSELFGHIFDSIIVYEGEIPLLELCRCLSKGRNMNSVPNLIYKEGGSIIVNNLGVPERAECLPTPCFDGLPLDMYFSPYLIIPILSSRGCYWGQCAFCSHGTVYANRYRKRPPESVVEDLQNLTNKHSSKFFTFNDEAISPVHLRDICDAILSAGIDIKSTTDLRVDSHLTRDLIQTAYDAGFRVFFYGQESGSNRLLAHMKKGTDITTAKRVFRDSSDAGIWNHAFVFFGFPTETLAEAHQTMDFVFANKDIIHSVGHSTFQLARCSPAMGNPKLFGITAIHKDINSFMDLWASYTVKNGLTMEQAEEVAQEFANRVEDEYSDHFIWSRLAKDHILLYVSHYKTHQLSEILEKAHKRDQIEQPSMTIELTKSSLPRLKSGVLCGLAGFDVAAMLLNTGNPHEMKRNHDGFFILWDLDTGRTVSATLTAGAILGRCDGRRTLGEIAEDLAKIFQMPLEKTTQDCKKIISSVANAGLCILK